MTGKSGKPSFFHKKFDKLHKQWDHSNITFTPEMVMGLFGDTSTSLRLKLTTSLIQGLEKIIGDDCPWSPKHISQLLTEEDICEIFLKGGNGRIENGGISLSGETVQEFDSNVKKLLSGCLACMLGKLDRWIDEGVHIGVAYTSRMHGFVQNAANN